MNSIYEINKNIEKIKRGGSTYFLNPSLYKEISYKLKRDEYKIYSVYLECDKVILYKNKFPNIKLFRINSYQKLKHADILGSLFALGINDEMFGDIVIDNDNYYVYLVNEISEFVKNNLIMIGNSKVSLEEVNMDILTNYQRKYEVNELIVSSVRIDTVISRIIGTNRDKILDKIKSKEIILNYNILTNSSYKLREDDVFSIRRFGKYKFIGIIKSTKKDNFIIKYYKYI